MKGSCPLKTNSDWVALESSLGEDNAYKIFIASTSEILPEPVKAAFYLYAEKNPKDAAALLDTNIPATVKAGFNISTTVFDMIDNSYDSMFQDAGFKSWLKDEGYAEKIFQDEKIIRTPELEKSVEEKFDSLKELAAQRPDVPVYDTEIDPVELQNKIRANEILHQYALKFDKNDYGIRFNIISSSDAQILLKGVFPYRGEAVFAYGNTIYYVQDKITLNTQFADLAMPIIALSRKAATKLFNEAYEKLEKLPIGQALIERVAARYPDVKNRDTTGFKEKVLAEALKEHAKNARLGLNNEGSTNPGLKDFNIFIKDYLGVLRTEIRRKFNTDNTSKLNTNSSLDEIAALFNSATFKVDNEKVDAESFNEFNSNLNRGAKELTDTLKKNPTKQKINETLQAFIENFLDIVGKQTKEVKSARTSQNIKKELIDPDGSAFLTSMAENLKMFRKNLSPEQMKALEKVTDTHKAQNLVNTLFTLEANLFKMNEYLERLKNSNEPLMDKIVDAITMENLLKGWANFIEEAEKNLLDAGVERTSYIYGFVTRLDALTKEGRKITSDIKRIGSVKQTTELLKSFTDKVVKQIDDEIKRVESIAGNENYKRSKIKELNERKEKYNFTEEKVNALYQGKLGDSNFWSNMFVSYTSDPDPILATFAIYLKSHTSQITAAAFARAQQFSKDTKELMAALGMNSVNFKSDWSDSGLTMIDKKAYYDENGELQSEEVISFMTPVKNWRFDLELIKKKIRDARESGDKAALEEAYKEKEQIETLFNREYLPKYYADRALLINESPLAYEALQNIDSKISEFRTSNADELDFFEHYDDLTILLTERERLFSLYDENGVLKDDEGLAIATALKEHRKRTGKYYESVEKKGAFQRALDAFIQKVNNDTRYANIKQFDENGNLTPEFNQIVQKWIQQNSAVRYTQAYYDKVNDIFKKLEDISKRLPKNYKLDKLYEKRTSLFLGYKDNNGQVNPELMKDKMDEKMSQIKEIQETINDLIYKQQYESDSSKLTADERSAQEDLKLALAELSMIRYTEPSSYYLEAINNQMIILNKSTLDEVSANDFLTDAREIDKLLNTPGKKYEEFKKWFEKNHVKKYYQNAKGEVKYNYERLHAWSIARPLEEEDGPAYYQTTKVHVGKEIIEFSGVPNSKYFYTRVKNNFRTVPFKLTEEQKARDYVGKVIDNKGNFLPLTKERAEELGVPTSYVDKNGEVKSYINEDYYKVIQNENKKKLLEVVTNYHIQNQVGLETADKLYLDIPRLRIKQQLEAAQRGELTRRWSDWFKSIKNGVSATISGKTREEANEASRIDSDVDEGLANPDLQQAADELSIVKDGLMDPVLDKLPMKGLSRIPINEVSYDIVGSLNFYMLQAERQRVLSKINPMAKAMLATLDETDAELKKMEGVKRKNFSMTDSMKHLTGNKNKGIRTAAFRALYNREFKGEMYSDKHLDWLNKVTNTITGAAATNYFALNLPSAIKNYWGMIWQSNIEAIAGDRSDVISLAKARTKVNFEVMPEWSSKVMGANYNTVNTQMILMFDPAQGKAEEVISRDYSRTFASDLASISWVYSPRKYMEMQGALHVFYAMMYHEKIPRIVNGNETKISYADAFELDKEGRLTLKSGIDEAYGVTYDQNGKAKLGEEFVKMQNAVHEKFKDLNGAFAKFEQPQAQQFFAYRLFAFMRRYFTSMFMYRFGGERANFPLDEIRTGYYIEAIKAVGKTITSLGKSLPYMSNSEKMAMIKVIADVAQIFIISAAVALMFGWDPDDKDRFEKLRKKSGALGAEDFHLDGWLSNHALTLLLKTQAENQSFIPLPGFGLDNYLDLSSSTSLAFGPTVTSYAKIMTDLALHAAPGENESLYYKRDAGPYPWQKEGEAKIWNHFGSMVGFSGSQVDPVKGLQTFDMFSRN